MLITMGLGEILGGDGVARLGQIPIPKLFGSAAVGIAFSVWLASKSVSYGRRYQGSGRIRLASVLVAVVSFVVLGTVAFAVAEPTEYYNEPAAQVAEVGPAHGVPTNGRPVSNLFPYDENGTLLSNIRLFDQNGQPVIVDGVGGPATNRYPRMLPTNGEGLIPVGPPPTIEPLD